MAKGLPHARDGAACGRVRAATKAPHVGYWASFNGNVVIEAIKNDAAELRNVKKSGGDKNCQIDRGV